MPAASHTHPGVERLRAAKGSPAPPLRVEFESPAPGRLRPVVTQRGATAREDVARITAWRNRFPTAFLSEFVATEERTERWLVESLGPDDTRILFMLEDEQGTTVGHIGLASIDWASGYAEADSVVRGGEARRGLVTGALHAMWRWAGASLGLTRLGVRVRSDNPAVAFYEKVGFRELRRVPLRREPAAEHVRWVEDPDGDPAGLSIVYMELRNGA